MFPFIFIDGEFSFSYFISPIKACRKDDLPAPTLINKYILADYTDELLFFNLDVDMF